MKKIKNFFKIGFYSANIILIILYLFPGSIVGWFLYNDHLIQPQITRDFIISSNHVYAFALLTSLELFHIIIPNRGFEMSDLFGNIVGVILVILIYKIVIRYVKT